MGRNSIAGFVLALISLLVLLDPAGATGALTPVDADPLAAGGKAARETLSLQLPGAERIDKMQAPPPPVAVLEFSSVRFWPKWAPIAVGKPIKIYAAFSNKGPRDSTTSEFRVYLSLGGQVLQKMPFLLTGGLRGGRSSYVEFQITLPDSLGRHCWEVSFRQTDDGRMVLGRPKQLCAVLKAEPVPKVAR